MKNKQILAISRSVQQQHITRAFRTVLIDNPNQFRI
jgi:hypothetical protein